MKKILVAAVMGVALLGGANQAQAQHLDMSHILKMNLDFENQFYPWAWQRSMELGRQIPPGQLPFNALTLSQANQNAANAWSGFNAQWHANGARTHQALNNWSDAFRGYGHYQNTHTGNLHQLPWTHNNYHMTPNGYIHPGAVPPHFGYNLNPYYGR